MGEGYKPSDEDHPDTNPQPTSTGLESVIKTQDEIEAGGVESIGVPRKPNPRTVVSVMADEIIEGMTFYALGMTVYALRIAESVIAPLYVATYVRRFPSSFDDVHYTETSNSLIGYYVPAVAGMLGILIGATAYERGHPEILATALLSNTVSALYEKYRTVEQKLAQERPKQLEHKKWA